ncbi:DUF1376 domain-containing protein [Bartonella sp. Coyote22sub2]|uniref:YdaU family protein n=1 Tax=Bartonella sp. Coyote22sub2 TaxID=1933911 RepID=UPI00099AAF78|nr:DUF1376 domain-containing protein [Bartonella sp. Coyote22sub2]AQX25865.1 putative hypothetical protein YdaU, DUF1376 family [Bartonella sp. Coyote22sub2]
MKQVLHSEAPHYESSILPYVCWYQNDFLGGVRGMRAHEIGIYTILLNEMYARGRPLNLSIERLARLCGCDKRTFESVLEMLITEGKILQLASGLWNTRCEIVFHERAKLLEQKSSAGRSSAKKRKKINEQFQHLLNASPLDVERNSEAQKTEEKETPTGVSQKKPSAVVSSASFCDSPSPQKDIKGCQLSPDQKTEEKESPNGVSQKKPSAVVSSASFCDSPSPKEDVKGCRLPPEWRADIAAAISEGLNEEQALWQEKKFRDYWQAKSGKDAKKVDWTATWRNWYRREIERLQENDKRLAALSSIALSAHSASALSNDHEERLYSGLINY